MTGARTSLGGWGGDRRAHLIGRMGRGGARRLRNSPSAEPRSRRPARAPHWEDGEVTGARTSLGGWGGEVLGACATRTGPLGLGPVRAAHLRRRGGGSCSARHRDRGHAGAGSPPGTRVVSAAVAGPLRARRGAPTLPAAGGDRRRGAIRTVAAGVGILPPARTRDLRRIAHDVTGPRAPLAPRECQHGGRPETRQVELAHMQVEFSHTPHAVERPRRKLVRELGSVLRFFHLFFDLPRGAPVIRVAEQRGRSHQSALSG